MVYYQCHLLLLWQWIKNEKQRQPNISSSCLQNVTANHRVNDVIATEDGHQTLVGRFMYGPLDMVTLTGEKVRELWSAITYYAFIQAICMQPKCQWKFWGVFLFIFLQSNYNLQCILTQRLYTKVLVKKKIMLPYQYLLQYQYPLSLL